MLLSRPAHATPGYKVAGKVVRAFAPHCPVPREESWYLLLTDPANNLLLSFQKVWGLVGGVKADGNRVRTRVKGSQQAYEVMLLYSRSGESML